MQDLNFGKIENLYIINGEPIFDPRPRIIRRVKVDGENWSREEIHLADFELKNRVAVMVGTFHTIGTGMIQRIEVKHGLPLIIEYEEEIYT
jgi:hypothetical protein